MHAFFPKSHDHLRDLFAKSIDVVAYDVRIEPHLHLLTGEVLPATVNKEDEARLDVSARGYWQLCKMTSFDIRVFSLFAKLHKQILSILYFI